MTQATFKQTDFHARFIDAIIQEIPSRCRICLDPFRSLCIYVMKIRGLSLFQGVDMTAAKSYVLENAVQLHTEVIQKLK